VSTSSAPLTKTNGGDGKRFYDQVILRAAKEVRTSALPITDQPRKKKKAFLYRVASTQRLFGAPPPAPLA
jgi:hypothetical protein